MAWVERLVTRTSQPQDAVGVDWSNPLTRGLAGAVLPVFGEVVNRVPYSLPAPSGYGIGPTNTGLAFKSTSNNVRPGFAVPGQWARPTGDMTLLTMTKLNAIPSGSAREAGTFAGGTNQSYGMLVSIANGIIFSYIGAGGAQVSPLHGQAADLNRHVHVGTVTQSTVSLYRDGLFRASATNPGYGVFSPSYDFKILGDNGSGNAAVQDLFVTALWHRALSDAEIKSLSNNPWQIFEPEVQRIWVDDGVSAGGPGDAFGSASDLTLAATAAIGAGAASASAGAVGLVLSQASAGATGNAQASSPLADLALSAAMATATGDAQSTGLLPNLGLSPAAATATGGATASATASVADLLTSPASASATGQAQTSGSVAGLAASAISGTAFNTALGTALGSPANVALSGVAGLAQGAASTATSVAGIALAAATGAASNTADAQAEAAFAALLINPTTGAAYGASHAVGSLPLVALAAASGTASSATVTKGRPASDTSNTGWAASTGVDLYAMLDEEVPSAIDYISASSVGAVCEMALNSTTYPGSAAQRLRYRASSSTGHSVIVRLKQGAIVIRSETQALTDTDTEYSIALTPGEIAAITSGALSVQLESAA